MPKINRPIRERLRKPPLEIKPALIIWALFVGTIPFYLINSGLPQPGNFLIFILVPSAIYRWNRRVNLRFRGVIRPLIWFTIWVCIVDYGWALLLGKWTLHDYTVFPLYYVFNATVFFIAFLVYQRYGDQFLRLTINVVILVVVFQVVASFFYRTGYNRGQLFFNNPNQLGYYALLAACLIAITQRRVGVGIGKASFGLTCCAYLAMLSASRAAVVGVALLLVLLVFSSPRLIIAASIAAIGLLAIGGPISKVIEASEKRMESRRLENRSFIEERGYNRLWEFKEYLVIGAGEGDTIRFSDALRPVQVNEIHSSAATILFSYGIIGSLLFLLFMYRVTRGAPLRLLLMLLPTLAYTIAHQGLRFAMLWVLLAVFIAVTTPASAPRPGIGRDTRVPVLPQVNNAGA